MKANETNKPYVLEIPAHVATALRWQLGPDATDEQFEAFLREAIVSHGLKGVQTVRLGKDGSGGETTIRQGFMRVPSTSMLGMLLHSLLSENENENGAGAR